MAVRLSKPNTGKGEGRYMGRIALQGNPQIEIVTRRSARARRLSLRVSRLDGRVTLTLPRGVSTREAVIFAREREDWLRGHLAGLDPELRVTHGAVIPVEGRALRVAPGTGRSVTVADDMLQVPGPEDRVGARVQGWLKARARDRIAAACDGYAARIGRTPGRITLRDTRSRWGSCSSDGDLMLSWRLIMAPPPVLDYVCAHEVAHLSEMNHSRAFWSVVEGLFPDWKVQRDWLRDEGTALHRVRFTD